MAEQEKIPIEGRTSGRSPESAKKQHERPCKVREQESDKELKVSASRNASSVEGYPELESEALDVLVARFGRCPGEGVEDLVCGTLETCEARISDTFILRRLREQLETKARQLTIRAGETSVLFPDANNAAVNCKQQ